MSVCRSVIKRSLSDGNILCESDTPMGNTLAGRNQPSCENTPGLNEGLSDSTPVISTRESDISYCRSALFSSIRPSLVFVMTSIV